MLSRSILFTDEKSIYLVCPPNKKTHVIRTDLSIQRRRVELPKYNFDKAFKFAAGICYYGKTPLIEITGKMSSEKYKDVLPVYFKALKGRSKLFPTSRNFLLQDKDTGHFSKESMAFIKTKKVKVLPWMSQGAECNVIENLWAILQSRVVLRKPKDIYSLKRITREEWDKISLEEVRALVNSFPKRIELMVKSKGEHIVY